MTPWLGVTAAWNYSESRLFFTTNNLLRTLSDYDAFHVANPLAGYEGRMVTVYNLHADKRGDIDNFDTNTTSNRDIYTGFEFSFNARFPGGGNLFGGIDFGRETCHRCDSPFDPNTFRFCDTTGGDGEAEALTRVPNVLRDSPPYLASFKMAGDYQLPFDSVVSFVLRSLPGPGTVHLDAVGGRTQSVRVRLNPPGSMYNERANVLDLSFGKLIDIGPVEASPEVVRLVAAKNHRGVADPFASMRRPHTTVGVTTSASGCLRMWRPSARTAMVAAEAAGVTTNTVINRRCRAATRQALPVSCCHDDVL